MKVESFHNWELERAIRNKNLQASDIAKKSGIDAAIFSHIKRGRMRATDEEEKAIAGALEMEVKDLFVIREVITQAD